MGDFVTATCHFPLLRRRDVVVAGSSQIQRFSTILTKSVDLSTTESFSHPKSNVGSPVTGQIPTRGALDRAPWQVIAALPTGGVAPEPAPFLNQSRHTSCTHEARAPRQVRHPVVSPAPPIALTQPPKGGAHGAQHVPPRPTTPGVFQHHSIQGDPSGASRCRGNGGDAMASGTSSTAARPWVGYRRPSQMQHSPNPRWAGGVRSRANPLVSSCTCLGLTVASGARASGRLGLGSCTELLLGASLSVAGSGLARFLDVLAQFPASRPLGDVCGALYVLHGIQVVLQQRLGGLHLRPALSQLTASSRLRRRPCSRLASWPARGGCKGCKRYIEGV